MGDEDPFPLAKAALKKVKTKTQMSKSALIQAIADGHPGEIARKDVTTVLELLAKIGYAAEAAEAKARAEAYDVHLGERPIP